MANLLAASNVEYLTVKEVAERLRVVDQTVYRKVKRGELIAVPIGLGPRPHLRIPSASVTALVSGKAP
jgi:excisionase family DNA binding protein